MYRTGRAAQSMCSWLCVFFFQAEDGIRDLVRSRGLGDVYKRQGHHHADTQDDEDAHDRRRHRHRVAGLLQVVVRDFAQAGLCLLYTSDAADERSSVDLGGRRIIKKKKNKQVTGRMQYHKNKKEKEQKIALTGKETREYKMSRRPTL